MKITNILLISSLILFLSVQSLNGQTFYRTGNTDDVETEHVPGILLAGGGGDHDVAMMWFLNRAVGGDVVVLRASGTDTYNDYLYTTLGVSVNSVTTIVVQSKEEANNLLVEEALLNAEAVFIAGGNQWHYFNYWIDTKLMDALNYIVNEKGVAIGGTSAGMAVLGEVVFTAENNTVWSSEALEDPYNFRVKLGKDFLNIPYLDNTVTDTHYNRPESDGMLRYGRHMAFMARMVEDWGMNAKGIAANEYTAIAIDQHGMARIFGDAEFEDYAYFLMVYGGSPEVCESGNPLTWHQDGKAVKVYAVRGDELGTNRFDLSDWEFELGGSWYYWFVEEGELFQETISVNVLNNEETHIFSVFPNPAKDFLNIEYSPGTEIKSIELYDLTGKKVFGLEIYNSQHRSTSIDISNLNSGVYFIKVIGKEKSMVKKWIKQ